MSAFGNSNWLACHDCGCAQPVIPEHTASLDEILAEAIEAYGQFVSGHSMHRTALLQRVGSDVHSDRPLWDPMAALSFEVTDGTHTYVVTSERRSIDEPRVYRFTPGRLLVARSEVAIDDRDLRRGLDLEFYPHALRPTKLDRFVSVLHEAISHITADSLEITFDVADDPAVSVARMPDAIYSEISERCA